MLQVRVGKSRILRVKSRILRVKSQVLTFWCCNQIELDDEMTASRQSKIPGRTSKEKRQGPRLLGTQEIAQPLARDAELFLER